VLIITLVIEGIIKNYFKFIKKKQKIKDPFQG